MSNYTDSTYSEHGENTSWHKALKLIPRGSTVLDIGCSSGNFGEELIRRKACVVDGVELDKGDVAIARKKLRKVFNINIETDSLSGIKDKYDVIYLGDVIEHLFYTVKTLERCKKLLKPKGILVFSIPNMAHVTIRLLLLGGDFTYTETGLLDKTHIHFFNLKEIKRVFNESGYTITKLDYVEKDYPDGLIDKVCDDFGIKVTKKFLDLSRTIDAAAFQFIGVAKPGKIVKHKLAQFGPIDFFETYHNNVIQDLQTQIKSLEEDAKKWREFKRSPVRVVTKRIFKR